MKYQPDNYSCGIYSIINALEAFGDKKSPIEVKYLTDTNKNGTSEKGILTALKEFGYKPVEYKTTNPNNAWKWVLNNSINYPLILIVDEWEHWIVVAGRIKNRIIYLDSKEGCFIYDKKSLLDKWSYKGYYGIKIK